MVRLAQRLHMTIETQRDGAVLWVTLNRTDVLNALDTPHLQALNDGLQNAADDREVRAVVVTGKGRAFSVGADIKAMRTMTDAQFTEAAELYQTLCRTARGLDEPILAALNGYALGGGLEIALMADIRVAARSAKLGLPDARLGFSPTGGLSHLLPRTVGAGRALDLAMTADMLTAEDAAQIGLVTRISEDDELERDVLELAKRLASYPSAGLRAIKQSFLAGSDSSLAAALSLEADYDAACYRSSETQSALREFLERRTKRS